MEEIIINNTMYSSDKTDWETPPNLFNAINMVCGFDIDVCATKENTKVPRHFNAKDNGLLLPWSGMCWMNPPYGRRIKDWLWKACEEVSNGNAKSVVALLPSRTDTKWWHDYVIKADVLFLKGRLKFVGAKSSAPFPSAIVIFGGDKIITHAIQQSLKNSGYMSCC